jgi:hypothetical protein
LATKDIPEFPPPFELPEAAVAPPKLTMFICYLAYSVLPMRDIERALTIALTQKGRDSMEPEFLKYAERVARQLVSGD